MKSLSVISLALLSANAFANLKIITTTADLAAIAAAVGGNDVSVSSIITGARDAHRIEAKPSYMSRVASADVFIAIGLELEIGYEQPILDGSSNSKVAIGKPGHIYASSFCYILDKPSGSVTRAQGDIHPYGNPHVLLDPYNGRMVAEGLAAKLSSLDKAHANDYKANLAAFKKKLDVAMFGGALVAKFGGDALWQWDNSGDFNGKLAAAGMTSQLGGWKAKMARVAGTPIITYHRSLVYLARRFGLRIVEELEPKPGLEPTPGHLASVIKTVGSEHVKAIVQETFFSTKAAKTVSSRANVKILVIPQGVGHSSSATDYISLFDSIVGILSGGL